MSKNSAGKGDTYRPVNKKKWDENFEKIFGHKDALDFHKEQIKNKQEAQNTHSTSI